IVDINISSFDGIKLKNSFGDITIRPIIFSIESSDSNNKTKSYINSTDLIDFIWECLCPKARRNESSTKYPLSNWGSKFEPIVKFFKDRNDEKKGKPSLEDLKLEFIPQ